MKTSARLSLLALAALAPLAALAQRDIDLYERDRAYCASGRSGMDFNSCMWRLQNDRDRYEGRRYRHDDWDRGERWGGPPPPPPPQRQWQQQPEKPKLSDMQRRALDNCAMLAPRDQPRCRATVMSTVR